MIDLGLLDREGCPPLQCPPLESAFQCPFLKSALQYPFLENALQCPLLKNARPPTHSCLLHRCRLAAPPLSLSPLSVRCEPRGSAILQRRRGWSIPQPPPPASEARTPPRPIDRAAPPRLLAPSPPPLPGYPSAPPGSLVPPAPPWSGVDPPPAPLGSFLPSAPPGSSVTPALPRISDLRLHLGRQSPWLHPGPPDPRHLPSSLALRLGLLPPSAPPWATVMAVAWVPPGSPCSGSLLSLPWLLPPSSPPWSLSAGSLPGVRPPPEPPPKFPPTLHMLFLRCEDAPSGRGAICQDFGLFLLCFLLPMCSVTQFLPCLISLIIS